MKKISQWAKAHKWSSRIMIVTMYILLNLLGWLIGTLLPEFNASLTVVIMTILTVLTLSIFFIYPYFKRNYTMRKACDLVLITCTFAFVIAISNSGSITPWNNAHASAITSRDTNSLKNHPLYVSFKAKLEGLDKNKLSKREKRRIIKTQVKAIMHAKDLSAADKTLLIVLSVLLGIALLFGVALLSCSIACSGSEALAVIVAILGVVGVVFLIAYIIRSIQHPRKRKEPEVKTDTQ